MPSDLLTIAAYLGLVFLIALVSRRKNSHTASEHYLAGKSLTLPESLFSIIATETSALTFLGIPAFAYNKDFSFIHIYFGAVVGRFLIARYFLPKIYDKGLTLYEIITKKGTAQGQRATSLIYFCTKVLSVGVRLYSGSILVSQFFSLDIYTTILLITALTSIYTLVGGLKAVARTDILQMFLFIGGGVAAHLLIPEQAGSSWGSMMAEASAAGKTTIVDLSSSLGIQSFVIGIVGGTLFDICTHGTDQNYLQRLFASRSLKKAQLAISLSSFISIFVGLLFLGVGALLWTYYQHHPVPMGVKADELFAHFITQYFPSPLKGFMVAGILAATMSTLDSTMNALSACLWNDILPKRQDGNLKKTFRKDLLIIAVLLVITAFVSSVSEEVLILGLKVTSWTVGSVLALFLVSAFWQKRFQTRLDFPAVLGALVFCLAGVAINTFVIQGHWLWNVYWGTGLPLIFLYAYPRFTKGRL